MYAQPVKPLAAVADSGPSLTSQQVHDDLLDIDDVIGKRIVTTRLHHNVTVREENALAALEVMSRFAANPKWLIIIYGPEYLLPENLDRLRSRSVSTKRSLALREFALGIEALERFVRQEPLRRVHECVFGVLALESEPVDPRL